MTASIARVRSLTILVVSGRTDVLSTGAFSGFKSHSTLVCSSSEQAMEAVANGYIPDVVMIDTRLVAAELDALIERLHLGSTGSPMLVALCQPGDAFDPRFDRQIERQSAASELERALWEIAARKKSSTVERHRRRLLRGIC